MSIISAVLWVIVYPSGLRDELFWKSLSSTDESVSGWIGYMEVLCVIWIHWKGRTPIFFNSWCFLLATSGPKVLYIFVLAALPRTRRIWSPVGGKWSNWYWQMIKDVEIFSPFGMCALKFPSSIEELAYGDYPNLQNRRNRGGPSWTDVWMSL